jgi:beta-glucosidase
MLFDALYNRSTLDPLLKGSYPELMTGLLEDIVQAGDLGKIQQPLDFLGLNHYTRFIIRSDPKSFVGIALCPPPKNADITDMGWEVYPQGFYEQLLELKNDYGNPRVYITENGAAFKDVVNPKGVVDDQDRIRYLEQYLEAVYRAKSEGAKVEGYFIWSLTDNFEWAEGYAKRFGIVHMDYATQKRTPKASYYWYQKAIREGGFNISKS